MNSKQLLLLLAIFTSTFLHFNRAEAQCNPNGLPTIEIGEICGTPGTSVLVPIIAHNFDNVFYYNLSFCFNGPSNFFPGVVFNDFPGSNSVYNATTGQWTLFWGHTGVGCPTKTTDIPDGTVIARIRVNIDAQTQTGSCVNIDLCNVVPSTPSHILQCFGNALVESTPTNCGGSVCVGPENISTNGYVYNMNGLPIENARIFNSTNPNQSFSNLDGYYSIPFMSTQGQTSIDLTAQKASNMNGLTDLDIVAIRRHILGIAYLDCYQRIAADVDGNGIITQADALAIQNSILYSTQFGNAGDWIFIPADYNLTCSQTAKNTVPYYPTSITISDLCQNSSDDNWIGIKVGDVNGSGSFKSGSEDMNFAETSVSVGPNPFSNQVTLNLAFTDATSADVHVFDLAGKLIHETTQPLVEGAAILQLDATTWPTGTLMYQVIAGEERHAGRMVHVR